ncbi:NAD(P)/FAD-dependent oxidoreductase [Glycomyces sp. TRM65418]|uniref:NAD(P)/FAD-dependent oxidoreductase n=1 Tax=Glycomyces sp. TRM65418 TaxID=2867006 RepID=UPI001CE7021C|nr:NAD(P)/FAD-dependent oxidoreductase [Glycomyces sp. TRM65418]MCC3763327.1 NAD(P)/FAD-dependent oxidoreductase [Glycomyces sp. TRM65418]QZD57324.1 NAD(P)/FAD-dependent oxidoreductase [Glycomyces sp. TRM65418]
MTDELKEQYDVVVIGGGAAGLNGALMLARARRSVAVVDAGEPRNAPADGVHGLLGREGMPPSELLERGRGEVRRYGGHVVAGNVTGAKRSGDGFTVSLEDGRGVRARRLLVTTGLVDRLPAIPGLAERWGRDVIHCPYCHGWEVRDRAIGIVATGPISAHGALLFRQWTSDLVFFTNDRPGPSPEDLEKFAARGIRVVEGPIARVEACGAGLTGVRMADGELVEREALAVASRMEARAGFLKDLGLKAVDHPSGAGEHIVADPTGRTEVPGVWAAGNVTDLSAQVGASAAAGAMAGAQINMDLVNEETDAAVAAHRAG